MFVASRTSSILRDEIFKRRRALFCPSLCTAVQIFSGPAMWNRADGTLRGVIGQYKRDSPPDFADLPPGVGFEPKDEPLRRDINLLGRVLGQVIVEQEGKGLFDTEEEVRLLCKRLRFGYDPGLEERLKQRIEDMNADELQRIVRAFSVYFQLVNIAERYHRIRRRRQYESLPVNPPHRAASCRALARLYT